MPISSLGKKIDIPAIPALDGQSPQAPSLSSVPDSDRAKVHEVAKEFEAVFLDMMFQAMRKTVGKSDLMDGGAGEEVFRGMLDSEYAKILAAQKHTGISDLIAKDMLKAMENQNHSQAVGEARRAYEQQRLQESAYRLKSESEL